MAPEGTATTFGRWPENHVATETNSDRYEVFQPAQESRSLTKTMVQQRRVIRARHCDLKYIS